MPILTRRAAAANKPTPASEDDSLPPPNSVRQSNKGTATIGSKSKTKSKKASKAEGKRNRPSQHANSRSQPSSTPVGSAPTELPIEHSSPVELPADHSPPIEPPIEHVELPADRSPPVELPVEQSPVELPADHSPPVELLVEHSPPSVVEPHSPPVELPIGPSAESAHSSDEGDEVDGSPSGVSAKAKSSIDQQPLTLQSSPQASSGGVPQTPPQAPSIRAKNDPMNPPANHPEDDGVDGDAHKGENTGIDGQDDEVEPRVEGHEFGLRDSRESPANESSSSNSDYSDTRKNLIRKRQQHKQLGRTTTDTEEDDGDNDNDNGSADEVDSNPCLPNATRVSSSDNDDNQRTPLKTGRLSAQAKQDIGAFSTEVLEMAEKLANRHRTSRKNILIAAGFGIKESRGENIANLHARWYAATHTKPDEMPPQDYARQISVEYHKLVDGKTEEEKSSNLKEAREWAVSQEMFIDDEPSLASLATRVTIIRDKFANLSQSVENLYDISVIGALIYMGSDAAGQQISTLFTGSPGFRQLIDENKVNVGEILDRLRIAVKAPGMVAEGFNIPTFTSEPPQPSQHRQGESDKDRNRRVAGIIFRDSLASFLPAFFQKGRLPWKSWVEFAAKEELCIVGWKDGIKPPGPDFEMKKLESLELRDICGSYGKATLNSDDDYEAQVFSVRRWPAEQRALSNTHPLKGSIPLVVTENGVPVRQLRDSRSWQKIVAKQLKNATRAKDRQNLESDNEGKSDSDSEEDTDEQYNGNQSDQPNKARYTVTHGRSFKGYPTQPRPQPKPRTGTISRRQSVQLDDSDDDPHPLLPSAARIDPPLRRSSQRGGTPVDLRRNFRSQPSPSGDPTLRGSHSHLPSRDRMYYEPPPHSDHPRLLAPPLNPSPPRRGTKRRHNLEWSDDNGAQTKRRNPGWSDDNSAQIKTGLYFHRIDSQGRLIPRDRRDEASSSHSRNVQANIPQQSYPRHPQRHHRLDAPNTNTNIRPRASTSQSHAASSISRDVYVPSMPSASHQLHTPGYRQPSLHRSFRSHGHYTPVRQSVSTIQEEEAQMDDYSSQYVSYDAEVDGYDGYSEGTKGRKGDVDEYKYVFPSGPSPDWPDNNPS